MRINLLHNSYKIVSNSNELYKFISLKKRRTENEKLFIENGAVVLGVHNYECSYQSVDCVIFSFS